MANLAVKERLNIPFEETKYITPEVRQKIFLNILDNYKVYLPNLKRIHAFLNWDKENPIDYLVMFKARTSAGSPLILYDMPILYSSRTTPAFRYVIKNDLYADFYKDAATFMCKLPESKFNEFIIDLCGLSFDKKSELYWKRPENSKEFIANLIELQMYYKPTVV
jgi:hypothetical protein